MDKIFQSGVYQKPSGVRYWIEIIPKGADALSTPFTVDHFPPSAIYYSESTKQQISDDLFGKIKPKSLTMSIELTDLDSELQDLLLDPFLIEGTGDKKIVYTNIWTIYSDYGDEQLSKSAFPVYFRGGMKAQSEIETEINQDGQTQAINLTIASIDKLLTESIRPVHIIEQIETDHPNMETTGELFDMLWRDVEAPEQIITVINIENKQSIESPDPTDDFANAHTGKKTLTVQEADVDGYESNKIFLYESDGTDWILIASSDENTLKSGTLFNIEGSNIYRVMYYEIYYGREILRFTGLDFSSSETYGQLHIPQGTAKMLKIKQLFQSLENILSNIYQRFMRQSCAVNVIDKNNPFVAIKFYKQQYISSTAKGAEISGGDLYFLAFLESNEFKGGFFAPHPDDDGIASWNNLEEFLQDFTLSTCSKSYFENEGKDLNYRFKKLYENIESHNAAVNLEIGRSDQQKTEFGIKINASVIQSVTGKQVTFESNPDEYETSNPGTLSEDDVDFDLVFHTMPFGFADPETIAIERSSIALDSSYYGLSTKQLDFRKLYYKETAPQQPSFIEQDFFIMPNGANEIDDGLNVYLYEESRSLPVGEYFRTGDRTTKQLKLSRERQQEAHLLRNVAQMIRDVRGKAYQLELDAELDDEWIELRAGQTVDILWDQLFEVSPNQKHPESIVMETNHDLNSGSIKLKILSRGVNA